MRAAALTVAGLAGVAALLLPALPAAAQEWSVEARAGRLDFQLDGAVPAATSLGLSLARDSRTARFQLSTGVPLGEEDPLWGAASLGGRAVLAEAGPLTLALDAAGQAFVQRYQRQLEEGARWPFERVVDGGTTWGHGLAAQALPAVAVELGPVTLHGRAGASWYRTVLAERERTRTVALGDVRLALRPAPGISLSGDARHYAAPEGDFTFGGATAVVVRPELSVWGSVGHWFADSVDAVPWSAGAALPLSPRLELTVEAREDALDPIYGSVPRRAWSAGLRLALSTPPTPARPVPADYRGGRATIALPVADAPGAPRIAGDFTDWEPRPMTRSGDEWRYAAALEPGVYEYAFVAPDGTWFVPASVPGRKDDGMGGEVALLVVEGSER